MEAIRPPFLLLALMPLTLWMAGASAQETVIPVENVRMDYAQVLRVEPVFQTLTATRMEEHCDDRPVADNAQGKGLSRIVGKVRSALTPKDGDSTATTPSDHANCRMVQVQREFRRPIAYDVDYMYKGMKYRSRLSEDPGNRLRVRVSVTPSMRSSGH